MLSECFAELSWENTHLPEAPATDTGENAHPPVTLAQFLRGKNRPFTEASERRWPVSLLQLLQQAPRGGGGLHAETHTVLGPEAEVEVLAGCSLLRSRPHVVILCARLCPSSSSCEDPGRLN